MLRVIFKILLTVVYFAAALDLPTFISDHMVLPRSPLKAQVWGNATPNAQIVVSLVGGSKHLNLTVQGNATSAGNWLVELPPQQAGDEYSLIVTGDGKTLRMTDIAVGDLWLCSGQSNMQFSTNTAFEGAELIANSSRYPQIRLATVANVLADTPQTNVGSAAQYAWARSSPGAFEPVGGPAFTWFSAACYTFGVNLYRNLGEEVPIGLIAADWGGTALEIWSSPDVINDKTCGGTRPSRRMDESDAEFTRMDGSDAEITPDDGHLVPQISTGRAMIDLPDAYPAQYQCWYAMIYPLLNFRFTGAVWYQGEANSPPYGDPKVYACRFPAMIADWRKKFNLPSMSFLFVQLAAYFGPFGDYSDIRSAQMSALALPKVSYATAIDLGDPQSPEGPVHSRRKIEVGRRLALAAMHVQYGAANLGVGPYATEVSRQADGDVHVTFKNGTAQGLHSVGAAACETTGSKLCCKESPFLVLVGHTWQNVTSWQIEGSTVRLQQVDSQASMVRFDWSPYPQCVMLNGLGGPDDHTGIAATPFEIHISSSFSRDAELSAAMLFV